MTFLWIIFFILFIPYVWLVTIPYIKTKCIFYYYSFKLKQMAKKYDGELRDKLNQLSEDVKNISDD